LKKHVMQLVIENHFGDQIQIRRALAERILELCRKSAGIPRKRGGDIGKIIQEVRNILIVLDDNEVNNFLT